MTALPTAAAADRTGGTPVAPAIVLDRVTKAYATGKVRVVALHEVSVRIDGGTFVVVVGPSGSGKSTLLNVVGAIDVPTSGTVRIGDRELTGAKPGELTEIRRRHVSFVFQSFNLFPALTARENVEIGADLAGRRDARRLAAGLLEEVGLAERADHFPHQLSGGEQQRVGIARGLATGNPVLLADEPTGELDHDSGVQILGLLRRQADAGRTVVVVTHNREIARLADRVLTMASGRITGDGPPAGGRVPLSALSW